jgi:hypothetical protein
MLTSVEGIYENGAVHLLEQLPGVVRARVVVTVLPDAANALTQPPSQNALPTPDNREAASEPLTGDVVVDTYRPRTELGRKLIELRRAHAQAGGKFLNWDEIDEEARERRGGVASD